MNTPKILVMIPVRLGSRRVKKKNIRLLGNKPLVEYIIDTTKKVFSNKDIYLNSYEDIFKSIAEENNIQYYKRPEWYASDEATNDDFVYDFLKKHKCDWVIQAHSTSPFITEDDIRKFINFIKKYGDKYDTVFSVKEEQIEAVYRDKPINYPKNRKMLPSQELEPVKIFCNGLMAFKRESFISNYENRGYSLFAGETAYITLSGFSTLDIDNEEDFRLAEAILESKKHEYSPSYYNPEEVIKDDVPSILKEDGIDVWDERVVLIKNIEDIKKKFKNYDAWAYRIVNSENNSATIICQKKGGGNRNHYHKDWNEWWFILEGKWKFIIEGKEYIVKKGDIIYIPKKHWHHIISLEDNSIRIAVSREDVGHIYKRQ